MKTLYAFVVVFLLASIIDAAPKPAARARAAVTKRKTGHKNQAAPGTIVTRSANPAVRGPANKLGKAKRQFPIILQGSSLYPTYYIQHASPVIDFQNSFLQAAFLSGVHYADLEKYSKKHNLTDSNGKASPPEAASGDEKDDAKDATDLKAKIIAPEGLGNINIINPFVLAKDLDGKVLQADGGLPGVKAGKLGDANSSVVALVNPHGGRLDPVFGPEIAPRYEIHYSPQGITLDPLPPFAGAGINSAIGVAPGTLGAPIVGPFPAFGIAPSFNTLLSPYPYPFFPGFDPKSLKPNGKSNGGKKLGPTDQPTETTSETFQEPTSESSPSEGSETTSESSASEAQQ